MRERNVRVSEAMITAARRSVSINSVSQEISATAIQHSLGKSLASVLEEVSGVSSVQTGSNIAKPVIQGMHGTRILIVNNGARQTGQQWGIDHAPEIDMHGSRRMLVVKGAESVRYGSEALGGIILMEQKPLPYGESGIRGSLTTLYGTNGRRHGAVASSEGGLSFMPDMAWRVQATRLNAGDRSTARYLLNNTGSRELNFLAAMGLKRREWQGELFYSRYDNRFGVMRSAQMGNEELLTERIALGQPSEIQPFQRTIDFPHQHVVHHNATLQLRHRDAQKGTWTWQTTFQHDIRTENRIRRLNRSNIPAVSLHLTSLQHQLNWRKGYGRWSTETGGQWLNLSNRNEAGTGIVPIIPNHTENSFGLFAVQKYASGSWSGEAGLRYDHQTSKAAGYDWTGQLYGGTRHFNSFTYSLGGRKRFSEIFSVTSNFGLAWRAPHVFELYSNGNELGSGMFVRGDATLASERGYKWITSAEYQSKHLKIRMDGFLQWIDNYIYDEPTHRNITVVSGAYPVFQYKQTSALFRGLDFDADWKPLARIDYRMTLSLIWAHERRTGNYLPHIPAPRLMQELRWHPAIIKGGQTWMALKHRFVARQTRFNPATDLIPTTPPAYHLWGFEMGMEHSLSDRQKIRFFIAGDNIFNLQYKEYTNRSRYYAHDLGRDIRCSVGWSF